MEQNFQTSFIPKKPIVNERSTEPRPVSLVFVIALLVLFTVLLATGGLLFYKTAMKKKIAGMENTLNLAKSRFEPARIAELQVLDKRLRAANEILAGHISVTPIFKLLEQITMKTVRYTDFSYELSKTDSSKVIVKMSGVARGYRAIALQSDLFAQNKNLIDPVFSNLTLDPSANVLFDLEFAVDSNFVNYKQTLPSEI